MNLTPKEEQMLQEIAAHFNFTLQQALHLVIEKYHQNKFYNIKRKHSYGRHQDASFVYRMDIGRER